MHIRRRLLVQAAVAAVATIAFSSSAMSQEVRLGEYRSESREPFRTFNKLVVAGLKSGLIAYNVALGVEGKEALFCLPPKLALTTEQAEDIINRTADQHSFPSDSLISLVLLQGLEETFPCKQPK
jgi:hypothetical protein